jgi:hypothetical protein
MPRIKTELPKPDWFVKRDYAYLKKLDAKGWYAELTRLYKLSVDHDLGLHKDDPNIIIIRKAGEADGTTIGQIGVATVQFVGRRGEGFWVPRERLPALIVNVDAPDEVILRDLKRTLKAVRSHSDAPVVARGRYALNSRFDEKKIFKKWQKDQIVQLAELLAWCATPDAPERQSYPDHIPDLILGKWVGKDDKEVTSEAKATLKKALASLPAFAAQIAQDMVPAQIAQEMIAARIAKDI